MTRAAFSRSFLALTLGMASLVFLIPQPAAAGQASTIIRPSADFVVALWNDGTSGCQTDASRFDALVEDPQDGNTTCRATGTAGDHWQVSLEDPGSPNGIIDIDVFVSATGRISGDQTLTVQLVAGPGCDLDTSDPLIPSITSAAYVTVSLEFEACATRDPESIEWTEALLVATRIAFDCVPGTSGLCFLTHAYVEVRYTIQDEPGAPPPEPPPPLPEQIIQAAAPIAREACNLWLILLALVVVLLAVVVRHVKRTGDIR